MKFYAYIKLYEEKIAYIENLYTRLSYQFREWFSTFFNLL